jgi:outer membrane protein assembly factor BamB
MRITIVFFISILLFTPITVTPISINNKSIINDEKYDDVVPDKLVVHQWPMGGNDAQNTCLSNYTADQNDGYEKWKYFTEGPLDGVTPVIDSEGTLYVSSRSHGLYAIYPNGTSKWHSGLIGDFEDQPVIGLNGTIYVGTIYRFHAFYPNGTLQWILPMEKYFCSQPVVSPEGIIYVGTKDGYLYAVYPNGTIKWEYYLGYSIVASSLDAEGNIYFTAQHCDYLYCLYPNGTLRWTFETIQEISDAPLIGDDGTIYTVPIDNLIAINPNGTEKWRIPSNGAGRSPALAPDGTIVYSSDELEDVFGLNPEDGQIKWHYQLDFDPDDKTRPAISSDGTIFFAYVDEDGDRAYLSALNPDGTLKWTSLITSDINPYNGVDLGPAPSIDADGTVYVTTWFHGGASNYTRFGYVHAFGQPDPNAPSAPTITGPAQGKARVRHEYTFTSTSPTGDDLCYFVMWGDDTNTGWTKPFPSGKPLVISHSWSIKGTYTILARAKSIDNLCGPWGNLNVRMPKSKILTNLLFLRLVEKFPFLQKLIYILK